MTAQPSDASGSQAMSYCAISAWKVIDMPFNCADYDYDCKIPGGTEH